MEKLTSALKKNEKNKPKEQDKPEENFRLITVPSDGGYAWVMVFASFMINFLVDGVINNFGKMLPELCEFFQTERYRIAIVGSLFNGTYFLASPFASALINHCGFRKTGVIGTILAALFMFLASTTNNLHLLTFYHFMCGIGTSFLGSVAAISLGYHFDKYRPLVFGIATAGSGVGTIIVFVIIYSILQDSNWKSFMSCESIILIGNFFLSLFYLQPKVVKVSRLEDSKRMISDSSSSSLDTESSESLVEIQDFSKELSVRSRTSMRSLKSLRNSIAGPPIFPTIAEVLEIDEANFDTTKPNEKIVHQFPNPKKYWIQLCSCPKSKDNTRPLYKDDIMYVQSISNFHKPSESTKPEVVKLSAHTSTVNVQLLITRTPDKVGAKLSPCCEHLVNALKLLFDVSLFKLRTFRILALGSFFYSMAMFVPYIYITDRALDEGMKTSDAQKLLSIIGGMNSILRVAIGVLLNFAPRINATKFTSYSLLIAGIAMIVTGFRPKDSFMVQVVLSFFYVQGFASNMLLRSIIYVDTMGLERLTNVYGLISMIIGFGLSLGTPILGIFKEFADDYVGTFVVAGVFLIAASISFIFLPIIKKREELGI